MSEAKLDTNKFIEKISLQNYEVIQELNDFKSLLSDEEKTKKIDTIISKLSSIDKQLLKEFNIKFSDKEKERIIHFLK